MKLLVVEDERELADDIVRYLSDEKYRCEVATTYEQAMDRIHSFQYDCILLDLMIPGGTGLDILEELKQSNRKDGIIIISAKNSLEDKVKGLKIGADDYLAKPFHLAELSARIHSVIRRNQFNHSNNIIQDNLNIDLISHTVRVNDRKVYLTKKEYDLLLLFLGNKNKVLPKSALAEYLSGDIADMFDSYDFIYAHVKNLKKKLQEAGYSNRLKTIYGIGYKWEV